MIMEIDILIKRYLTNVHCSIYFLFFKNFFKINFNIIFNKIFSF